MDHIRESLDALGERFESLAEQLDEAAGDLREGQFPNGGLVPSLQETREQLEEVFEDVSEKTEKRDLAPPESPYSLPKLEDRLKSIREAEEVATRELVEGAHEVLRAARTLRHESDSERLEEVRAQVREVEERIDDGNRDEAEAIVEGRHSLAMLVAYATRASTLSDDEYEACRDEIEEVFGRSLLRDVDRGRITKGEAPEDESAAEESITASDETSSDGEAGEPPEEALKPTERQEDSGEAGDLKEEEQKKDQASDKEEETVAQDGSTAVASQSTPQPSEDEAEQQEESAQPEEEVKDEPDAGAAESEAEPSEELEAAEAEATRKPEAPKKAERDPQLPWTFIREEKAGLAYWAARALEELEPSSPAPPAWLVRASALGPFTRARDADVAQTLRDDLAQFDRHLSDHEESASCNLLLASATLIPSLLAPYQTNAATYLEHVGVPGGLSAFNRCVADVREFAASRQRVSPSQFGSAEQTEKQLKHLLDEAQEWKEKAPKRQMRYQEATNVWRKWSRRGGPVFELLGIVSENRTGESGRARDLIDTLGSDDALEKQIRRFQKKRKEIEGPALRKLKSRAREAVGFGEEWLLTIQEHSSSTNETDRTTALASSILEVLDQAREELAGMQKKHEGEPLSAAAMVAERALGSLGQLVAGKEIKRPEHLLAQFEAPPLRLGLALDDDSLPRTTKAGALEEPQEMWAAIWKGRTRGFSSWEEAFEEYAGQRDHRATERIVQIVRASGEEKRANGLENKRDRHLTRCREAVERDADDAVPSVERAFTYGLFPSEERDRLLSEVDSVRRASSGALKLDTLHERLQEVRNSIASARETKLKAVQDRLEKELDLPRDSPAYRRVEQVIEDGDIHTAHDYIERLLKGESLPKSTLATAIDGFLPETLERITNFLGEHPDWGTIAEKLRSPEGAGGETLESIGPVSLEDVPREQREGVAELLSTWFDVRRREYIDEDKGQALLSRMGFNLLGLSKEKYANRICLEVEAEVPGPNVVPVPAYGSGVEGRYRVLCAWGRPSEEELLNATERLDYGPGLVVFYFAPLSAQERRRIARLCKKRQHEKGHRVLVIDEALMLYLCGQPRDRRLRALFECTLPFTVTAPYQSTPGYVPPEMFYGRKEEAARIRNPQDTSLVYGGRQLGKTALLRQVEQDTHRPPDQIARWIDLKSHGIGYSRKPAEVWPLLVQELKKEDGMLDESLAPSMQPETFIDLLEEWLAEESTRRILLLLDEADKFFEMDGQEDFRETARFKRLMERTGRQFKVVFAGLHNVYRTTRDPNQPLAHLQQPVCVGPLLDGEDKVEAARLVERPMAAVGYRFESSDLVPLILSQTNYYPSLIQDYCRQLLRDLNDRSVSHFDPDSSPPYRVKHEHVRESYRHQELLREIRKKFHLTLDLDKRYAVIAYAIAWGILEDDPEGGDVEGFSVPWVRSQALKYWSAGFQGNDEDDIDALLDEMVGLGVLRNVSSDNGAYSQYTLRSPNVLSLLGNRDAVETGLLKDRTPEPEYDQATFRRTDESGYLAPLTAKQTSTIFARESGVTTLFGAQAADLDRVAGFLSGSQPSAKIEVLDDSGDPDFSTFEKWLDKKNKSRAREGVTLLIIPQAAPWTEEWVEAAKEKIGRLKLENAFVRVLFLAGAAAAWRFVSSGKANPQKLASRETGVITLRPWHPSALYHWLKEWEAVVGDEGRQRISAVTGNWPYLLRRFAGQASPTQWKEDLSVFEEECEEEADDILAAFGLGDSRRRRVLSLLAGFDSPAIEEEPGEPGLAEEDLLLLSEDEEDLSEDFVSGTLRWADFLHLVRPEGRRWRVAPPLRRLLLVSS